MQLSLVRSVVLCAALAASASSSQSTAPATGPRPELPEPGADVCARLPLGTRCADPDEPMQRLGFPILPGIDDNGVPLVFGGTRVAANGGSLRNCASTGINLVGIPPGSAIVRAYLYWCWASLPAPVPGLHDTMQMALMPVSPSPGPFGLAAPLACRARSVRGTLVGVGPDPCWLGGGNFVYRADVTALVTRGGNYTVWIPAGAAGATDWSDPWGLPGPVGPLCEGASLVVVYANPIEPAGTTYLYDGGLAGTMFLSSPGFGYTLTGFAYPGIEARWLHVGADGQQGAGYPDLFDLGLETTVMGGVNIAGGGFGVLAPTLYNDSDWNGSANKPLGQLWDTSGHDVTFVLPPGAGAIPIAHVSSGGGPGDCLVAVCDVLWMR